MLQEIKNFSSKSEVWPRLNNNEPIKQNYLRHNPSISYSLVKINFSKFEFEFENITDECLIDVLFGVTKVFLHCPKTNNVYGINSEKAARSCFWLLLYLCSALRNPLIPFYGSPAIGAVINLGYKIVISF